MLDKLSVEVRLRTPWEAADLGLLLLRSQARTVYAVVALLVLPPALALGYLFRGSPLLAVLLLWWLKPLLDRAVLLVLAKATFGEAPGILDTLRQFPGSLRRGLLAQLLWRRFSPERSLLLPVWQLERPDGVAFRARRQVLLRRGRAQAILLTLVFFLFQVLFWFLTLLTLAYFSTQGDRILDAAFGSTGERLAWLDSLLWVLPVFAMYVLEPLYVAAGFGLYLNRRVQLEGWDLELAFRHLGERARRFAARGLGACLLVALLLSPNHLQATPTPKEAIQQVSRDREFSNDERIWKIKRRESKPKEKQQATDKASLFSLPKGFLGFLGTFLKILFPSAIVLALAYFLWSKRTVILSSLGTLEPLPVPGHLFGLDIRPAALPRNIPRAALALWDAGDHRGALSLLYRGALAHLVQRLRSPLGPGSTEGDCLARARESLPEPGCLYFSRLMGTWLALAYGGRAASPGDRGLCEEWSSHFGGGPA